MPPSHRRSLLRCLSAGLFSIGAFALLLLRSAERLQETKAVVGEEFAFGASVYDHLPHLAWAARIGMALAFGLVLWRAGRRPGLLALGLSTCAAGYASFQELVALAAAPVLLVLFDAAEGDSTGWCARLWEAYSRLFSPASFGAALRGFARVGLWLFVVCASGSVALSAGELLGFTRRFGRFVTPEGLEGASLFLPACASAYGALLAARILAVVVFVWIVARVLARWNTRLAVGVSLISVTIAIVDPVAEVFADLMGGEMRELGLVAHFRLAAMVVGYLFFTLLGASLRLHVALRTGRGWIAVRVGLGAGLAALIYGITIPLYPEIVDYSTRLDAWFARLLVLVVLVVSATLQVPWLGAGLRGGRSARVQVVAAFALAALAIGGIA